MFLRMSKRTIRMGYRTIQQVACDLCLLVVAVGAENECAL